VIEREKERGRERERERRERKRAERAKVSGGQRVRTGKLADHGEKMNYYM
jgi:hypothetical protein